MTKMDMIVVYSHMLYVECTVIVAQNKEDLLVILGYFHVALDEFNLENDDEVQ